MYLSLFISFNLISCIYCSLGDSSPFFQKCTEKCSLLNCTEDGLDFISNDNQPLYLKYLMWDCESECKYDCMWKTTEAFQKRNWRIPQFYGKWPFVRIFGIQEPASFIASLLNLYVHCLGFMTFKKNVRSDAPLYWLWQSLTAVFINGWIWSSIFHARDSPFTEFMDYTCAYSIVLMNFYCGIRRVFWKMPKFLTITLSAFIFAFFVNHILYLSSGKFDYSYNMKINLITGLATFLLWSTWCFWKRKQQPYLWKCASYFTLGVLCTALEIFDFPPIFWTFDTHALWHFSTFIICPILNSFMVDDCKYLRNIKQEETKTYTKFSNDFSYGVLSDKQK